MQSNKQNRALNKEIAESIGCIVRYSTNEKFRNDCYQALNVDSTFKLERAISERLDFNDKHAGRFVQPRKQNTQLDTHTHDEKENAIPDEIQPTSENVTPRKPISFPPSQSGSWLKAAAEQNQRSAQKRRLEDTSPSYMFPPQRRILTPMPNHFGSPRNVEVRRLPSSAPALRYFDDDSSPGVVPFSLQFASSERDDSIEAVRKMLFANRD